MGIVVLYTTLEVSFVEMNVKQLVLFYDTQKKEDEAVTPFGHIHLATLKNWGFIGIAYTEELWWQEHH